MEILRRYKNPNSPRGPLSIDPETGDVVHHEYTARLKARGSFAFCARELEIVAGSTYKWAAPRLRRAIKHRRG
jgi:hypothetical protein